MAPIPDSTPQVLLANSTKASLVITRRVTEQWKKTDFEIFKSTLIFSTPSVPAIPIDQSNGIDIPLSVVLLSLVAILICVIIAIVWWLLWRRSQENNRGGQQQMSPATWYAAVQESSSRFV